MLPLDAAGATILTLTNILSLSWRVSITTPPGIDPFADRGKGHIYCFWHSTMLPCSKVFAGIGVKALISPSRDGDRIGAIIQRWRHDIIRGSSNEGGSEALRLCLKELKNGQNLIITPDGPRGPVEKVKDGIAMMALRSGAVVIPATVDVQPAWRLKSWDRFIIPKPFAKISIVLHTPIVPADFRHGENSIARMTAAIQSVLDRTGSAA